MEDIHSDEDIAPTYKLMDMAQLYRARLEQLAGISEWHWTSPQQGLSLRQWNHALVRVAQAVRKDMFDAEFSFNGSFPTVCQRNAVPSSLLALVHMILDGANSKHHTQLVHTTTTTAVLSISQLLVFNMDETCSHQHITTAAKRLHSPSISHSQNPCSYQK